MTLWTIQRLGKLTVTVLDEVLHTHTTPITSDLRRTRLTLPVQCTIAHIFLIHRDSLDTMVLIYHTLLPASGSTLWPPLRGHRAARRTSPQTQVT